MAEPDILINRAPVLALWASIVVERIGVDRAAALSLGKAMTGLERGRGLVLVLVTLQ